MDILEFFFPKRCVGCRKMGDYVCSGCFAKLNFTVTPICAVCSHPAVSGLTHPLCRRKYTIDGVFSSLVYQGVTKRLLAKYKFSPYLSSLTPFLGELFYDGLIQQEVFYQLLQKNIIIIPIPLHKTRFRQRGYNQSTLLAKEIGKKLGFPVLELLQRIKLMKTQVGLNQKERRENIRGVFSFIGEEERIGGRTIFLVDDILTSGATLSEAAKVLKKKGAKNVYGLTLAHGQ